MRAALRSNQLIPIRDTSERVDKQDLEHLNRLSHDGALAYGLAYELVAYISETYGGLEGFWKLVAAYDKTQQLDTALQQAFGVSYTQFATDWQAWLERRYP